MRLPKLPKFQKFRVPRNAMSDVLDLAGIGCLVGAAWWWLPILGLVVTGLALLLIGRAVSQ